MSTINAKEFATMLETTNTKLHALKAKDPKFPSNIPGKFNGKLLWLVTDAKEYLEHLSEKDAKPKSRDEIARLYKEGLTIKQVSEQLGIAVGNVKQVFYTMQRDYVIEKNNPFDLMNQALRNRL